MIDAGSTGPKFTWNNKRTGGANIQERLDRVLINSLWRSKFHNAQVKHLSYFNSDNRAIVLDLNPFTPFKHRPFRGEAIWTEVVRFTDAVRNSWKENSSGSASSRFVSNINNLHKAAKIWNKTTFGDIRNQIKTSKHNLTVAQDEFDSNPSIENKGKINRCLYEYLKVLQMEETFWKKKSRVQWLAEGNRNTKFFHVFTLVRRNRNKNTMLKNSDGIWLHDKKDIEDHIVTHFEAFLLNLDGILEMIGNFLNLSLMLSQVMIMSLSPEWLQLVRLRKLLASQEL